MRKLCNIIVAYHSVKEITLSLLWKKISLNLIMNGMYENEKKNKTVCTLCRSLPLQIMSETCYDDIEKRINTTVSFKNFN